MKILHLGKYYPPFAGGIENYLQDLAIEQVRQGHQVLVFCHHHQDLRKGSKEVLQGVEVNRSLSLGILAFAPLSPGFGFSLKRILQTWSPDVLHIHMPNVSAFWILPLLKKLSVRVLLHWHADVIASDKSVMLRLFYPGYRIFENALLRAARWIIVSSDSYLRTSRPLAKYRQKCRVIPLGLRRERMHFFEDAESAQIKRHKALSVGRFTYYKGFEYLLKAAAGLEGCELVIAGEGPLWQRINKLKTELGLESQVFLPGKLSNAQLHKEMSECTVFCLPSIERTEAFGLVLLEAMHYGKPLLTTLVSGSGMNEVNVHKETGLAVRPEDPQDLCNGLKKLIENKELREKMGRNSLKRLKKKFLISEVCQQVLSLYQE